MARYAWEVLMEFEFDASSYAEADKMFDELLSDMGFIGGGVHRHKAVLIVDSALVDGKEDDDDDDDDDDE
jgi:hypothetical protein